MPLPIMTDKDDIDAIVKFLGTKPVGISLDSAKATVSSKLLDHRKLNAYRTWGFITDIGSKLELSPRGREYLRANEDAKSEIFREIVRNQSVYNLTIEWIYHQDFESLTSVDLGTHWYNHFRSDIGTETEEYLTQQVTCFFGIAQAAKLGQYIIGRKGQPTRLQVNRTAIAAFVEKTHSTSEETDLSAVAMNVDSVTNASALPTSDTAQVNVPLIPPPLPQSSNPSLHIDIQIHVSSDATPEQIDQIFASMAKHLYKSSNG